MQVAHRGVAVRGMVLFALAGLVSLSALGDQGCVIQILSAPPPPATGQGAPAPTGVVAPTGPAAPGTTTNPPTVQILSATTVEVDGYAIDTQNPTNSAITVDLLPVTSSVSGTVATTPAPLLTVTANVSDSTIANLTQQGHGFRFTLSQVANPAAVAAGQSIICRATNTLNAQVASTAATVLTSPVAPAGTTTTPTTSTTTTAATTGTAR